jgi:parallel beta-helix repeat protein
MDSAGVYMGGNDNRIDNSIISDNGQVGIFGNGYRLTITNSQILRNNTRGFNKNWEAGGMKLMAGPNHINDSFVMNSVVAYNYGDGIWFDWMNNNNTIENNIVAYNSGHGIHYEVSQKGFIRNNLSYGNRQRGIFAPGMSDGVISNNSVFSNGMEGITIIDDPRSATYPLFIPYRNTFYSNSMAWNDKVNYIQLIVPGTTYENVSDRNVFKAYANRPRMSLGYMTTTSWSSGVPDWRIKSLGMDMNSIDYTEQIPLDLDMKIKNQEIITRDQLPLFLQKSGL